MEKVIKKIADKEENFVGKMCVLEKLFPRLFPTGFSEIGGMLRRLRGDGRP